MDLSALDLIILAVILLTGAFGLWAGALRLAIPFTVLLAITTILYTYPQISIVFKDKPLVNIFFYLSIGFIGLVIFAVVGRLTKGVVRTTGLGPLDHLMGLCLGLIVSGLLVGTLVWGVQTYGGGEWKNIFQDSNLAPDALSFFKWIMAWTQRFFPRPEIESVPWWRRTLW